MSTNKIFVVGDIHGSMDLGKLRAFKHKYEDGKFDFELTKDDYVIVCGDFGLLWNNEWINEYYGTKSTSISSCPADTNWNEEELMLLDFYERCPWTTLFVDG